MIKLHFTLEKNAIFSRGKCIFLKQNLVVKSIADGEAKPKATGTKEGIKKKCLIQINLINACSGSSPVGDKHLRKFFKNVI